MKKLLILCLVLLVLGCVEEEKDLVKPLPKVVVLNNVSYEAIFDIRTNLTGLEMAGTFLGNEMYMLKGEKDKLYLNHSNNTHAVYVRSELFKEGTGEEESRSVARGFVKESSTYRFDGQPSTFTFLGSEEKGNKTWEHTFSFSSSHAGYGDREGRILAQVITEHTAVVLVEDRKVISGVLDGKWDMKKGAMLGEKRNVTLELSRNKYEMGEPVEFTLKPNGNEIYIDCTAFLDWKITDVDTNKTMLPLFYGCNFDYCDRGEAVEVCTSLPEKVQKIAEDDVTQIWYQKDSVGMNVTCGNETYVKYVAENAGKGEYALEYTYGLDEACAEKRTLEAEFEII